MRELFKPGGVVASVLDPYELRQPQIEMAERVAATLREGGILLAEAATGTGKTWAYLVPAILSGKKVVISTGTKTLQDQLCLRDLPLLSKAFPGKFTFSLMKGKSNYLCLHRFGRFNEQPAFPDFDKTFGSQPLDAESHFRLLQQWSMETRSGDRAEMTRLPEESPLWREVSVKGEACLGSQCPTYDRCYITRMKQEAAGSDIVVVNHHLFFADLALKDVSYGEVLPRYDAAIFDEAHLLEEVATQYFGVSISSDRVEDFVRDARREFQFLQRGAEGFQALLERCDRILSSSSRFFEFFRRGEERYPLARRRFEPEVLGAGRLLFQAFDLFGRKIASASIQSDGLSRLLQRVEELQADLRLFLEIEEEEGAYVYWGESRRHGAALYASPLEVSEILRDRLFRREIPIVLTSATLSCEEGFDYLKGRLGIDAAEERIWTSPFDYERQTLLYLPSRLPGPTSRRFAGAISDEIVQILEASQGRALLLFTSWRNLEAVHRNISGRVPYLLLKQGDRPKHALIDLFRREVSSVLLGTTSFWQGVDVPGEALSCVVIDKLPFASPTDPLVAARIESLTRQGKDPFRTYQVPAAVLSLRQGIGRLIRNREDRGVIAILDTRMRAKGYGRSFLSALPPSPRTDRLQDLHDFFAVRPGRSV